MSQSLIAGPPQAAVSASAAAEGPPLLRTAYLQHTGSVTVKIRVVGLGLKPCRVPTIRGFN